MNPALAIAIAQIIAQYGIPVAQQIWQWTQNNREITQADWDLLNQLAAYKSADALTAAGIRIVDGKVVPINPTGGPFPPPAEPGA